MPDQRTLCKKVSPFTIVQYNCRNIISNGQELKSFLYSFFPTLVCLCETHLKPTNRFKVPGYKTLRSDRLDARGGGLAMLIREGTPFLNYPINRHPEGSLEVQAIKLGWLGSWVTILNLYNPCQTISPHEFEFYLPPFLPTPS